MTISCTSFFSIVLAKSLDFGTVHTLISGVINQISEIRNEDDFSKLYDKINEFTVENNIDLNVPMRARRAIKPTSRFKNCSITTTIGREEIGGKSKYRISIFYPVIDSVLLEMNNRFSKTNVEILRAISSLLSTDSSIFLEIEELKSLCMMLQCDIRLLNNEIEVLTPMLKQLKPTTVVDLYLEVFPLKQSFPSFTSPLIGAMTFPVSSTTAERTFSKMKLIKTVARNSMSDNRLSDLSLLAIERVLD